MRNTPRRIAGCLVGGALVLGAGQLLVAGHAGAAPTSGSAARSCTDIQSSASGRVAGRRTSRQHAGRCDTPRPEAVPSRHPIGSHHDTSGSNHGKTARVRDTPVAGGGDEKSGQDATSGMDARSGQDARSSQDKNASRRGANRSGHPGATSRDDTDTSDNSTNTAGPARLPLAPQAVDGTCAQDEAGAPAITIPADDGVTYRLDGERVASGAYPVSAGRHRVRAVSHIDGLRRSVFTLTVRAASCDNVVSAGSVALVAPSVQVDDCVSTSTDTVQVRPAVTVGVDYRVAGVRRSTSHVTVRVEATARAGYRLSTTGTDWRQRDAAHASYRQQLAAPAACPGPTAGTRSVARGTNRSAKFLSAPCGSKCVGPVVPTPPSFRDDTCVAATGQRSGASYVVPSMRGVLYWVNGADIAPGAYPARDGSTVTVVTSAASGYSLSGISQWTHTFGDAPNCSGVGSGDPSTSPPGDSTTRSDPSQSTQHPADATRPTPANTGVPTGTLLTGGLILLLLGAVLCLAGARPRPDQTTTADAVIPNRGANRFTRRATQFVRTLAGRSPDVSLLDPTAGAGRTPPRPAPAAGRVGCASARSGRLLTWRVALTAADP